MTLMSFTDKLKISEPIMFLCLHIITGYLIIIEHSSTMLCVVSFTYERGVCFNISYRGCPISRHYIITPRVIRMMYYILVFPEKERLFWRGDHRGGGLGSYERGALWPPDRRRG